MSDPQVDAFVERWWTSDDGLNLFARDYAGAKGASRLPIVCLHGLTRNSLDFVELAPNLAATGRRVLIADVRGRGRSDRSSDPGTYDPKVYAKDVLGLLDRLGIGRAVFIGTSMGGLISLAIASKRPSICGGIVLNDVGPEIDEAGINRIRSYAGKPTEFASWSEAGEAMAEIGAAVFPDFKSQDWLNFAKLNHVERDGQIVVDCDPGIAVNLGRPLPPKFLRWGFFHWVARKHRILVIRGANSDILAQAVAERMARRANVELATVPGVGHAPVLTEPAALQALSSFLASVP